ncbi:acyltransferase [Amnibacterium sp. CER49]|uniref:acyltransferase n=1 Tax=Amnibacterium sp. CER49 TaxID=3039161 RepID=UPI00244AF508|nr:acyltransferase [Amnibacterium sp. CER49]MDH2442918.1 acyltransferase [Amnibacterium sp. CER49]
MPPVAERHRDAGVLRRRNPAIDIARGIAIIAIVLGHVDRGLASAHLLDGTSATFGDWDRFLYLFHVAVFAFLAGVFVRSAAARQGRWRYLVSRDGLFLYLYVLWSFIEGLTKVATAKLVNTPTSLLGVLDLARPIGQLWFLPWLIVVTALAVLVAPWRSRPRAAAALLGSAVVSLVFWGSDPAWAGLQGLGLWVFYFAGVALGSEALMSALVAIRLVPAVAITVAGSALYWLSVFTTDATPPTAVDGRPVTVATVALGFFTSAVGLVVVLAVSHLLASTRACDWLAFVGRHTLQIFLASITFASGMRIILSKAGVDSPGVHVALGTIAGVALPLALWWLLDRIAFPWLFALPGRRRTVGRSAGPVPPGSVVSG